VTTDLSNLCSAIDWGDISLDDDDLAESQYSRLANEAHALRLENEKLRDAIKTIECAIEAARVV
jgi:regulator of replication initiation timing